MFSRSAETFQQMLDRSGVERVSTGTMCRGVVLAHVRALNFYLIIPSEGVYGLAAPLRAFDMSAQPGSPAASVVDRDPITVGTPVWYMDQPMLARGEFSRPVPLFPIIGVDNTVPAPSAAIFPPWTTIPSPDRDFPFFTHDNDPVIGGLTGSLGISRPGDRGFGRPVDSCETDWVAVNPFKGYLKLGMDHVGMAAGPSAGIHFFTLSDTGVLNTGSTFVQDSPWGRTAGYPDGGGGFTLFSGFSSRAAGALGSHGETAEALRQGGQSFTTASEDLVPAWDKIHIEGSLVQGEMTTLSSRRKTNGVHIGDPEDRQNPATISHHGYDGTVRLGARHGLLLARDIGIDSLRQRRDEPGTIPQPDEDEPLADPITEMGGDVERYASQYAGLMYELMKRRFAERYLRRVDRDNWNVDAAQDICDKVFGVSEERPLSQLGEEDPCYEFKDDQIEVDDPVREGDKLKAASRGSYIYQSPTGAIVISDGHGAEIRMEGGNLTITAPGDIKILPGRDMAALVPRNAAIVSQGRMDLASDKGDVVVKAEKCASVTSVRGMATLESLASSPSTMTSVDDRKDGEGGGVVVRSKTTAAVLGGDVRIGVQSPDDTSDSGRGDHSGNIVIDANKGLALLYGEHAHVTGKTTASLVNSQGSGISATGEAASVFGSSINNVCRQMAMGGSGASGMKVVYPDFSPSGIKASDGRTVGDSSAVINIQGSVVASQSVAASQIVGGTVAGNTMGCMNASALSGIKMKSSVRPTWNQAKGITGSSSSDSIKQLFNSASSRMSADKLFSAMGSKAGGVYYPTSEEYKTSRHFWVLARWQRLLRQGGQKWKPNYVKDPTGKTEECFYPGREAWESRGDFMRSMSQDSPTDTSEGSISDAYVVNATVK